MKTPTIQRGPAGRSHLLRALLALLWLGSAPAARAQAPAGLRPIIAENAGGDTVGVFRRNTSFGTVESSDLGRTYATTAPVSVAGVRNAAPAAVYQTERYGNPGFTYLLAGTNADGSPRLVPGVSYVVRLHFAEIYFTQPGQRQFNVAINGQPVLSNFDIVAEAGGPNKALVKEFTALASAIRGGPGGITVRFTQGAANLPKLSAIEVLPATLFVTQRPVLDDFTEGRSYELGTPFQAATDGEIRAVRYWKAASDAGPHVGRIWNAQGQLLAQATFVEPAGLPLIPSGWQEVALPAPLRIRANATYTVSVNSNSHYVATVGGLNPAVGNGYLTSQGAGTYGDIGTFPTNTYQNTNYFRDVVFVATPAPPVPPAAVPPLVAVNAGGPAEGVFEADNSFFGYNNNPPGQPISTTAAVSVAGVRGAAPAAVYQTQRAGERFGYRLGGLNPDGTPRLQAGTRYLVRLHFAEIEFTQPGQRQFNVFVGAGAVATQVLSNFDIVAAAGGANKAVVREFVVVAQAGGANTIELQFSSRPGATQPGDVPAIAAIEILPATGVPLAAFNAGGAAAGRFGEDSQTGGTSLTYATTAFIDTTGVANPAPQAVYQTERYGNPSFSYVLTGTQIGGTPTYQPGSNYLVRLHFAEIYFTRPGERQFNVAINGQTVLTNFDIVAEAGGPNKALVKEFVATARSAQGGFGLISVEFTPGAANVPKLSGIEALPAPATTPRTALAATTTAKRSTQLLAVECFPNPAADRLTVHAHHDLQNATLRLTDAQGRTVRKVRVTEAGPSADFDLAGVADGLYYLLVPGAATQKIVVQH